MSHFLLLCWVSLSRLPLCWVSPRRLSLCWVPHSSLSCYEGHIFYCYAECRIFIADSVVILSVMAPHRDTYFANFYRWVKIYGRKKLKFFITIKKISILITFLDFRNWHSHKEIFWLFRHQKKERKICNFWKFYSFSKKITNFEIFTNVYESKSS